MRLRFVRVVGCFLLAAAPLAAQQPRRVTGAPPAPVTPASTTRGTLAGVVYDSLARTPLEGARVFVSGTSIAGSTDAGGRFRLDSVPAGPQLLFFEHPDLDSIGLTSNPSRVTVAAGRVTPVELTVPSLGTLRRSLCARATQAGEQPGIVFGTLLDAGSGARLRGGRVVLRWTTADNRGGVIEVDRPTISAVTDSIGNYYLCGAPTQYVVTLLGQAGRFSSGTTELLLGERGISRRDIAVSRDSAANAEDSTGQRRGRATIIGQVTDEHDVPRPSAHASVDDAANETFTDENGRFVLNGLPGGSQTLMVRMVGYSATRLPVLLRNDDTLRVTLRIKSLTVLDTIRITASNRLNQILLDEMEQRRQMNAGFFISGEEAKHRPSMRAVFSTLPAMNIEGRSVYNFRMMTLSGGRYRDVTVYVDGQRTDPQAIQSYRTDQIIGVEWFPHGQDAPIRYQTSTDPSAAVLLVWTRFIR